VLADDGDVGDDAVDVEAAEDQVGDGPGDEEDADHQAEDAEEEIGLGVHRGDAHEHHHGAEDQAGDGEIDFGLTPDGGEGCAGRSEVK